MDAAAVGALPNTTKIPSKISDLTEDSTHRTVTDLEKTSWNNKVELTDIPKVDTTLTESGYCADSKKVGEAISYAGYNLIKTSDPISSIKNGEKRNNAAVLTYKENIDTYIIINVAENLIEGQEYILSFDCSGVPINMNNLVFKTHGIAYNLFNGRVKVKFVSLYNYSTFTMDDEYGKDPNSNRPTAEMVGGGITLSNFSLEKGDFSAGYRPNEKEERKTAIASVLEEAKQYSDSQDSEVKQYIEDKKYVRYPTLSIEQKQSLK